MMIAILEVNILMLLIKFCELGSSYFHLFQSHEEEEDWHSGTYLNYPFISRVIIVLVIIELLTLINFFKEATQFLKFILSEFFFCFERMIQNHKSRFGLIVL